MSRFGKNLKKLRTVKKLSQQALADKIGLQRATLGAYEEERSEPKIETLIKIANEFSISIDALLKKELTVNELTNFKPNWNEIHKENTTNFYSEIPLVTKDFVDSYIKQHNNVLFLKNLPSIQLPIQNDSLQGFEIDKQINLSNFSLNQGDWVLCTKIESDSLEKESNYIIVTENGIEVTNKTNSNQILELWKIEHIFLNTLPEPKSDLEKRVKVLEEKMKVINIT